MNLASGGTIFVTHATRPYSVFLARQQPGQHRSCPETLSPQPGRRETMLLSIDLPFPSHHLLVCLPSRNSRHGHQIGHLVRSVIVQTPTNAFFHIEFPRDFE